MSPVKVEVTRVFTFDAAHRLDDHGGKCGNLHGHTYRLEVTVRGCPDGRGLVMDFDTLKQIVTEHFISPLLDHRFLNESLGFNTTAENMVVWFFTRWEERVTPLHPGVTLERVTLWETPTTCATLNRRDRENGDDGDAADGDAPPC